MEPEQFKQTITREYQRLYAIFGYQLGNETNAAWHDAFVEGKLKGQFLGAKAFPDRWQRVIDGTFLYLKFEKN